jgi:hypothetical protein
MSSVYNIGYSLNNLSLSLNDETKIFRYDEKNCKNKTTEIDYNNINKLNTFMCNTCLININVKPYHCDECNKDIGYNDYLYYDKEYKYIITEIYYHKIKNHNNSIDNKLIELIN